MREVRSQAAAMQIQACTTYLKAALDYRHPVLYTTCFLQRACKTQACCMQGTLAALDSRNPVLYINFPEGRLKFFGTIIFPKNKCMVLKFGNKDVLCEDVLENMVSSAVKVCVRVHSNICMPLLDSWMVYPCAMSSSQV